MEVAKLSAPPNLQVRSVSCNESAIKRYLSSELEETVFSLTHELGIKARLQAQFFCDFAWHFKNGRQYKKSIHYSLNKKNCTKIRHS